MTEEHKRSLLDHIGQFSPEMYPIDDKNKPTPETYSKVEELTKLNNLSYALFSKVFKIQYHGDQKKTAPDDMNIHPTQFNIGPFVIQFNTGVELNALNELNFIDGFDQMNKIELNKQQFLNRYGKDISGEVLDKLPKTRAGAAAYWYDKRKFTANECGIVADISEHWFGPIFELVESYNKFKNPTLEYEIMKEYLDFVEIVGHKIGRETIGGQTCYKPEFCVLEKAKFTSFNMNSKADLVAGFSIDNEEYKTSKMIHFSLILEAEVPTTNVLNFIRLKLAHDQDQEESRSKSDTYWEHNFNTSFAKIIKQMIRSNCNRGILTDYKLCLFIELGVHENQLELTYSLIDTEETYHFRYMLFSFLAIEDFDKEKQQRSALRDFVILQASIHEGEKQQRQDANQRRPWGIGGVSATSASTATTDFSSNISSGDIVFEGNTPATTESANEELKQVVKILGEDPYEPDEIAKRFKVNNLVLFEHNPEVIETSRNEIIRVDSSIMQDLGYDVDSIELSSVGPTVVIKLSPLESLFVEVDNIYENDESGNSVNLQKAVDSIYSELKIHLKVLHHFSDVFVVRVLHFGFLSDHTKYANTRKLLNWRFNGPYILMDEIEAVHQLNSEELKLLPLAVKTKIVGYYQNLHDINVIHNDVKPSNLFATFNGEIVKIIDFGNSYESDNESDKTNEIEIVKHMLGL